MYGAHTDSLAWISALRSEDALTRDQASGDLHALLLHATSFCLRRARTSVDDGAATDAADEALAIVLAQLDAYHGNSRFTTWAYKYAVVEARRGHSADREEAGHEHR